MRYRVLPYKRGSQSAKVLAESLGGLRLKTDARAFLARADDVLINWGTSVRPPRLAGVPMLNPPEVIKKVSDKLQFFNLMNEAEPNLIPKFWTDQSGIWEGDFPVVCRTVLNGHSGEGIVIARNRSELVPAPLYVKYIPKKQEYRIHVGKVAGTDITETIAIQRKARIHSVPDSDVDWNIRNRSNGFTFARATAEPAKRVTDAARRALEIVGLDFGAVDVIDNERKQKAYVLEINSAPGLEGATVLDYAGFFTTGGAQGIIPKAKVNSNGDGTWHVEAPYLDDFGRRRWTVEDVASWNEAVQLVRS